MLTASWSGITAVAAAIWFLSNLLCYAVNQNSWVSQIFRLPPLLCVSNKRRFADPQPDTYWLFDVLDPTDLAKSFWIGSPGLLLLRLLIFVYLARRLSADSLPVDDADVAPWITDFANWSFYLLLISAVLGLAVSLKYFATCHRLSKVTVRGRPGQRLQIQEPQHYSQNSLSTAQQWSALHNIELGSNSEIQPALPASISSTHAERFSNSFQTAGRAPAMQGIGSGSEAAYPADAATSVAKATKPDFRLPSELLYDSQLLHWSILEKVHCLVLQTAAVTSTAVLAFYWAADYSNPLHSDSYLQHAASVPVILLDVFLSKAPFASYHLQVMILFGSAYELSMWLYHSASEQWVYVGLNWQSDKSVLVYVFLPVVYAVLFFVWYVVALFRNYIGARCGSHRICGQCWKRQLRHVQSQYQVQELPSVVTGRLKKQSSNVMTLNPDNSSSNDYTSAGIIAPDTRYAGQQILTTGRHSSTQSPEAPSLMELSRRGSAPRVG